VHKSAPNSGWILALPVLLTMMALAVWLGLVAGLLGAMIGMGTPWPMVLLVGTALIMLAVWFAYSHGRRALASISI
jgi:hypothetical protein